MNHYLVFVYGVCFSLIAGGAFALMWSNIRDVNRMMSEPPKPRHPMSNPAEVQWDKDHGCVYKVYSVEEMQE